MLSSQSSVGQAADRVQTVHNGCGRLWPQGSAIGLNIVGLDSGKKRWSVCSVRMDDVMWRPGSPDDWIDGLYDLLCLSMCVLFANEYCFYLGFICAYQWVPGLHEQFCGAVPNAIRNAGRSVHGADRASLPGLLGRLHQLHRHPDFSEVLHPCAGWSTLLPQLKMAIMAHR